MARPRAETAWETQHRPAPPSVGFVVSQIAKHPPTRRRRRHSVQESPTLSSIQSIQDSPSSVLGLPERVNWQAQEKAEERKRREAKELREFVDTTRLQECEEEEKLEVAAKYDRCVRLSLLIIIVLAPLMCIALTGGFSTPQLPQPRASIATMPTQTHKKATQFVPLPPKLYLHLAEKTSAMPRVTARTGLKSIPKSKEELAEARLIMTGFALNKLTDGLVDRVPRNVAEAREMVERVAQKKGTDPVHWDAGMLYVAEVMGIRCVRGWIDKKRSVERHDYERCIEEMIASAGRYLAKVSGGVVEGIPANEKEVESMVERLMRDEGLAPRRDVVHTVQHGKSSWQ